MHNTLAASDYALIDEATLRPRPNYWSAVLWRRLMGTTVLDAGASSTPGLYLYAHCLRGKPGGVALLAINADRSKAQKSNFAEGLEPLQPDRERPDGFDSDAEWSRAEAHF